WFNIFGAEKATKADLHYKSLFLRIYKVKLLHNELPTLTNLKIRQPKVYTTNWCPRCNLEKEDIHHIWLCPSNTTEMSDIIEKEIRDTITKLKSKNKNVNCKIAKEKIKNLPYFNGENNLESDKKEIKLKHILKGLVPRSLSKAIEELNINSHNSKKIARRLVEKIITVTREKIWIEMQ